MVNKPWKIILRPLLETVLNNHAQHHRVPQPLILHSLRGVGKTTLILERLLGEWNKGHHLTGYVDFTESIKDHKSQPQVINLSVFIEHRRGKILAEIWPFSGEPGGSDGGLGLRVGNLGQSLGELGDTSVNRDWSLNESTVTKQGSDNGDEEV
ncbi:hypothetical protein C1H46_000121 [Malus baccata]|uniref:Uncharacterized protein n=1 Tax=Malus baccata TaxID=106549 RepID=A0A540NT35_MALBA|nr:hypothetical protein C1H46_000121 [Malus baccata]